MSRISIILRLLTQQLHSQGAVLCRTAIGSILVLLDHIKRFTSNSAKASSTMNRLRKELLKRSSVNSNKAAMHQHK